MLQVINSLFSKMEYSMKIEDVHLLVDQARLESDDISFKVYNY